MNFDKLKKANSLETHLEDLAGEPQNKVRKLIDILCIYCKPLTNVSFKKYLVADKEDFEIHEDVDGKGKTGVLFYWQKPVMTYPQTIGEFITVANSMGTVDLRWEDQTYIKYIYINKKY